MIGAVAVISIPNDLSTRPGNSPAWTVYRERAATGTRCVTTPPPSIRNRIVTSTVDALSFVSSTNVSKKPCAPSANSQRVAGLTAVPP